MRNKLLWFYQEVYDDQNGAFDPVRRLLFRFLIISIIFSERSSIFEYFQRLRCFSSQGKGGTLRPNQGTRSAVSAPQAPAKKKLFLTDGFQVPLTGMCIYMLRLNTSKQLPEEGFHKVNDDLHSFFEVCAACNELIFLGSLLRSN